MENFITGYPGHEHEMRAALLEVLGKEKYDFFFDKFLKYFFTREDAKFFASLGLNCIRIPINHRHFMDDLQPDVIKQDGFRLVDRIVEACAAEGIYTILDMHTFPGGQNQGWHSDSGLHRATFWEHRDFQDRAIQLWVAIAKYYKGNASIAGYNPMNEPADPDHHNLQAWYGRVEKAIREVDPDHILWLDGNTYSMDFSGFKEVLPNCVYAIHDYSNMGFPGGSYEGTDEQKEILRKQYERKVQFMKDHKVPIWNGEFGPVYASPDEANHEQTNQQRYNLLGEQMRIYKQDQISWSIWLYKDVGFQGMVYAGPDTAYIRLLKPFLDKQKRLGLNKWGRDDTHVKHIYEPLVQHLKEEIPEEFQGRRYPHHWRLEGHLHRVIREMLFSELLTYEFASYFKGLSLEQLDELAASFKLENCVKRDGLNKILQADAGLA
ncbi:glycoside hydrolase family 5 protein [Baudoinia panamericana UAMH 10762]|uniref:Glycoside hydrolase family 5 protein n=1 Tax=Baudoinia panamericana (strain UAMH 10762) TaxID=717646 RepID=M2NG64_BAUPA|nr:glycoside hydrolase family 5 protein [Baudoinia panamericana UAMH 10762]EMC97975.1 glycoside hydrolase family 5 protein [Baudoinia panamericana UAMH 10762]